MHFNQLFGDGEAEAGAFVIAGVGGGDLFERFGDAADFVGGDADSGI